MDIDRRETANEILHIVRMSLKFKKAIEQRLAWSQELRSLITQPRTKNNQELIDFIVDKFDGTIIDDNNWEHYSIKGKEYDIMFDPSRIEWSCDCKAFTYRRKFKRKYCKHIIEIQNKKLQQRMVQAEGRAGARVG